MITHRSQTPLSSCAVTYFAQSFSVVICTVGGERSSRAMEIGALTVIMGIGISLMYCPAVVIVTMYFEE